MQCQAAELIFPMAAENSALKMLISQTVYPELSKHQKIVVSLPNA
jgi:hypothetical protein